MLVGMVPVSFKLINVMVDTSPLLHTTPPQFALDPEQI